jgi:hypothetical protein
MNSTNNMDEENLLPHPAAIIESMRNIGYRPETAIADLVDNSISAKATKVQIEICPITENGRGWVRIEDNGEGMTRDELVEAMRWGGKGPKAKREASDLGRFGLGIKTASFSFGRRLTVISKKQGGTSTCRWDLDHVEDKGWTLLKGIDPSDQTYLKSCELLNPNLKGSGTIVLVTETDRLRGDGNQLHHAALKTALFRTISNHLGLVFHRFLDSGKLFLKLGAATINGWNLFSADGVGGERKWLRSKEVLQSGKVKVATYVLPHHKNLSEEEYARLGGPLGWNQHQGFIVYRSDRLIVPGGWLGFVKSEEQFKLARIAIDLPNTLDEAWALNVMKSKVSPPALVRGDLERIASAARRDATETARFHGELVAASVDGPTEKPLGSPFWKQIDGKRDVKFRINRAHPLVEALVQSTTDKKFADAFLHSFERLLPVAAILQNPKKSIDALAAEPTLEELNQLVIAIQHSAGVLVKMGLSETAAYTEVLSVRPFVYHRDVLAQNDKINKKLKQK